MRSLLLAGAAILAATACQSTTDSETQPEEATTAVTDTQTATQEAAALPDGEPDP